MKRWNPEVKCSTREERLLKAVARSRKLVVFLRRHRHELLSKSFQVELGTMYRDTGQGEEPLPPGLFCMALLLQGYFRASDAEVVRLATTDLCWRMVLGTLDEEEGKAPFSQGAFQQYRERFFAHDMDLRLLERTVELARQTKEFDFKKLPKTLRVGVDSRPLEGAGRVEDTFNLLGHAGKKIAALAAKHVGTSVEELCEQAKATLLSGSSTKAALDIDWNDPEQKAEALNRLCLHIDRLSAWVERHVEKVEESPLARYIEALAQVKEQDLEPGANGGVQIREGVAEDRRISIEDAEMRHGRKSKSQRIDGYKQHVATALDESLILAVAVTSANRPEEEATPMLQADLTRQGLSVSAAYMDRAYLNSTLAEDVKASGGEVVCKPWKGAGKEGRFGKRDFEINVREGTIMCPNGEVEPFEPGQVVEFDPEACGPCPMRAQCTKAATGRGRTVTMGDDEKLQKKLRRLQHTKAGRAKLRERVPVEHRLAHLANRQGPQARYIGLRKNTFDLRRLGAIQNLEVINRSTGDSSRLVRASR
jgi:hypothetical protein